jgi:hypothetical protein
MSSWMLALGVVLASVMVGMSITILTTVLTGGTVDVSDFVSARILLGPR